MTATLTRGFPPPGSTRPWNGRAVTNARRWLANQTTWPTPCPRCHQPVHPTWWHLGHRLDRQAHPELTWHTDNWQVEHPRCSTSAGATQGNRRRPSRGPGAARRATEPGRVDPSANPARGGAQRATRVDDDTASKIILSTPPSAGPAPSAVSLPIHVRGSDWPDWWPRPPAGQSMPALLTTPHPQAVGSYGRELLDWAGERSGMHPKRTGSARWWQELVAAVSQQHDGDGRLLFPTCLLGTPRQVGKSWWLRMLSMWRLDQAERWGELQTVVHTAAKLDQAEGVWRPASAWAARVGGYEVRRANGSARIMRPDGSAWIPQAATDQVGVSLSVSVGIVDEAWDVSRWVIDNGLEPTMAESASPQLWIVSTAGRPKSGDVSDLYPVYRADAMDQLDAPSDTLIMEWSAPVDADPGDPATWRAASPFWDGRRAALVGQKWRKAQAADAVDVFRMQWLNQWPDVSTASLWLPSWPHLQVTPQVAWTSAGVEANYGSPPVVAWAAREGDRVVVSVVQARSTADAAAMVRAAGVPALVGKSLLADAVWEGVAVEPRSATSARAVTDFRRLVDEGVLRHDGSPVLAEQVAGAQVEYGPGGARLTSVGRVDAVKAALWAAQAAWQVAEVPAVF